jgi:hypothetical protein
MSLPKMINNMSSTVDNFGVVWCTILVATFAKPQS